MLIDLLPPALRPAAKAVVAALIPLLGAVVTGLLTGTWDRAALAVLIVGVISSLLVYRTPNEPVPAPERLRRERPAAD